MKVVGGWAKAIYASLEQGRGMDGRERGSIIPELIGSLDEGSLNLWMDWSEYLEECIELGFRCHSLSIMKCRWSS